MKMTVTSISYVPAPSPPSFQPRRYMSPKADELLDLLDPHVVTSWEYKRMSPRYDGFVLEAFVEMTPALAADILDQYNSPNNRTPIPLKIVKLRNVYRDNRWNPDLPDSTLSFGLDGRLKNGQHRLHACVEQNVSFLTRIEVGHKDTILAHLDQTEARTERQQAKIMGRPVGENMNYSSVRWMYRIENDLRNYPYERGDKVFSLIDNHYNPKIWEIVPLTIGGNHMVAPIRATLLLLAQRWPEEVKDFVSQVDAIQFKKHSGAWHLFYYMKNPKSSYINDKQTYEGAMKMVRKTFKSFDIHLNGTTVTELRDARDSAFRLMKQMYPTWSPKEGGPFDPRRKDDEKSRKKAEPESGLDM